MVKNTVETKNICSELFVLTYGSFVNQLIKDASNIDDVNSQLHKIGYNIGIRLIEDFLSKNPNLKCLNMKETSEIISKNAFKCYLGVVPEVTDWNPTQTEFSLVLEINPLAENVELPPKMDDLWYSNVLAGIIKGALEMVFLEVDSYFVKDQLRGDNYTEIRIKLINKTTPLLPQEE